MCGQRGFVLLHIDTLPVAALYTFANLRACLALVGLLVGIEIFALANSAGRGVLAHKTIEETSMALATIAVAIARLLIKNFLDAGRQTVSILCERVGEERGIHGRRQLPGRDGAVKGRNRFGSRVLRDTDSGP